MMELLKKNLEDSVEAKRIFLHERGGDLLRAALVCQEVIRLGGTLFICGNGGSATDASHFSGELLGRFVKEREALACVFLGGDLSAMTAIANDYGYEQVYSRQLEGLMRQGDVLIGISTSGNSRNILAAAQVAKRKGNVVIALTGSQGGTLSGFADILLNVSGAKATARIQETHIFALHCLAELIEQEQIILQEQTPRGVS